MGLVALALFAGCGFSRAAESGVDSGNERRQNPIVRHMFTADPSAHVWADGRLYVYPSTDVAPARGCDLMDGYHIFSTDDMITWIDHGEILHSRDVEWGRPEGGFMWAPDCAFKDGVYYYYFPHPSETAWNDTWKIGIATSTNPASNFTVQGYIADTAPTIDPCVFMDDDGQVYFYQGGSGTMMGGKLKDNMVELDGPLVKMEGLDDFHEGPWVFKRNNMYYLIYPDNFQPNNRMQYAMSKKPLGPWKSQGVIMQPTSSDTMHGSVVEYKGEWYIFYHTAELSGGIGNLRSICFDRINFNKDGTIQMVEQTFGVELPTFHADINFNRMAVALQPGNYTCANLAKLGIMDDSISSIQIPAGCTVELFDQDEFKGKSWVLADDQLDLKLNGCDDRMSSVKVTCSALSKDANPVKNSSFENGRPGFIKYWGINSTNLTRSSESVVDGAYALKFAGSGSYSAAQRVSVLKHTNYELSVWIKVDPGTKGDVIFDTSDEFDDTCQFVIGSDQAGGWIHKTGAFNSGENTEVKLRCFTSGDFVGTCYWDNLSLKAVK